VSATRTTQYRRGIRNQPNNNDKKYLKIWPRTRKGSGPFFIVAEYRTQIEADRYYSGSLIVVLYT
jgi:hypothetical protein